RLSAKVKGQITRFARRLGAGLTKPDRRLVTEMLYGIQAGKDVKISNIARALNEPIALIKTEDRLCRRLATHDLTHHVNRWLSREGAFAVTDDTVLAVDLGDIRKTYAKAMEHLAYVHDGSQHGEIVPGYWLTEIVAAHPYGDRVIPMYGELYSVEAPLFRSENEQILQSIFRVMAATKGRGIVAIDRGGDRCELLIPLLDKGIRFVIRERGDRHVLLSGERRYAVATAVRRCRAEVEREVEIEKEGCRRRYTLRLGSLPVRMPERPNVPLWLVVIYGFGQEPIILLTNIAPSSDREHAVWIGDVYLTRWKCEETYRFLKQGYNLEDVRVRGYTALRNVYALLNAVLYFVSVVIGTRAKLRLLFRELCVRAKRFFEIAAFYQYAVADGIYRLLFASRGGIAPPGPPADPGQLCLFAAG
ncbi:transposase, partial [bacterium]|nr:transposase [bacterium]